MSISQSIKKTLPNNRFVRSVSILAGGTTLGQAILVLASPILTRLYTPEDFGLLAVYAALLLTIGVIASLRYQLAIPLPKSDIAAAHVLVLSLLVVLCVTAITTLAISIAGEDLANSLNTPDLASFLWLLPVGLLLLGTYQVFNYWAVRQKAFPAMAKTKLVQPLAMTGVQLGGSALGPVALLIGQAAGQGAGAGALGKLALWERRSLFQRIYLKRVWWAAKRYKRFPIYSTWGSLFNAAGPQLPPLLFAAFFNPAIAGIYLLAQRILAMPMKLVGKSIGQVFFSRAPQARREGNLKDLVIEIHAKLAQIAMPPALVLLIAGPDLFALVFGDNWQQAGEFARWMAPWIYLVFVTSPLSTLFSVLEKQNQEMIFQGILFATRVSTLFIGAALDDAMMAVALFSLGSALCYFGLLLWITAATGNLKSSVLRPIASAFTIGVLLTQPILLFQYFTASQNLWLAGLAITGAMTTCFYCYLFRKAC